MKDLYQRNSLKSGESDTVKIYNITSGFEEDREAAFSILLNHKRKDVYDKTHNTLKIIGQIRTACGVNTQDWRKNFSDYMVIEDSPSSIKSSVFGEQTTSKTSSIIKNKKTVFDRNGLPEYSEVKATSVGSRRLYQKVAWVAGAAFSVFFAWLLLSDNNGQVEKMEKQNKYVVNSSAKFYKSPSLEEDVVVTLSRYEDVTVIPARSIGRWDYVEIGEEGAYILQEELEIGLGEQQLIDNCRAAGVTRPESGELSEYRPTGIHKLIVSNPPGSDTLFKVKDNQGEVALFAYVRGGENIEINNMAEGNYYFEYSTGKNYGTACKRFLDDAMATRDQEPKYFNAVVNGFDRQAKTISYVLKNELFTAKRISVRHF